jgi:hypothetical protein
VRAPEAPSLEVTVHEWWKWTIGPALMASTVCSTALTAQAAPGVASDVCSLASDAEFQEARGVHPQIGIIPHDPVATQMFWGPHCDYSVGSIDLFTKESELERVLTLTKAEKQRAPVSGLGQRAFFTIVYPDDEHRRRGFLAIFGGPRIVTLTMDDRDDLPAAETRPRLEQLAKLVLPRIK